MRSPARRNDGELKARIDAAALHLFAERGAAATPMPLIAAAAGVAVGSLYRYYPSKEALVARLFADNYAELAHALDRVQRAADGSRAKLAAMTHYICDYFDREWDRARFLLLEQHAGLREYDDPADPIDVIERVVAVGIASGEIRPGEPGVMAALVIGPVVQAATLRAYGRLRRPLGAVAGEIAAATWAAIAATHERGAI